MIADGDRINVVISAFLAHEEEGTPPPSLDDLSPDEREEVEDVMRLLRATRGAASRQCVDFANDPVAVRLGYVARLPCLHRYRLAREGPSRRSVGRAPRRRASVLLFAIAVFVGGSLSAAVVPAWAFCRGDHEVDGRPPGDGSLAGQRVTVGAVWTGVEEARFTEALRLFEQRTGADVRYDPIGHDVADVVANQIRAGCAPDIVIVPQPGLVEDLAARELIRPVRSVVGDQVTEAFPDEFLQLAHARGLLYGIPYKADNKSLIWYNASVFEELQLEPPKTYEELIATADTIFESGRTPFSVAGADGWTLTDWFENIYLQVAGPQRYDEMVAHQIPWTDDSVRQALGILAQVFGRSEWLSGGVSGSLSADFEASVRQVLTETPNAAMVFEGDFVGAFVGAEVVVGKQAQFFPFPAVTNSNVSLPVVFGADIATLVRGSPAANELLRYLASADAAEPWARRGGFISPNRMVPFDVYPDPANRAAAEALMRAETKRFDLSDLQPPAFGASRKQGMWTIFQDFLQRPDEFDVVMNRLENERSNAAPSESSPEGSPWWSTVRNVAQAGAAVSLVTLIGTCVPPSRRRLRFSPSSVTS